MSDRLANRASRTSLQYPTPEYPASLQSNPTKRLSERASSHFNRGHRVAVRHARRTHDTDPTDGIPTGAVASGNEAALLKRLLRVLAADHHAERFAGQHLLQNLERNLARFEQP